MDPMERNTKNATTGDSSGSNPQGGLLSLFDWEWLSLLRRQLRHYWRLYVVLLVLAPVLTIVQFVITAPTYTATAVIGPPPPSPANSMVSAGGGSSSGIAAALMGRSGGSDPYQDFLQLLPSTRLSSTLIAKDHFDRRIFKQRWDDKENKWKSPSLLRQWKFAAMDALHRPYSKQPDADDLSRYLLTQLKISRSSNGLAFNLMTGATSYMQVSFTYGDPREAEEMLDTILREADWIIRDEQGHNVDGRIAYLEKQLQRNDLAIDERSSLIDILAAQQKLQMMIKSDFRYASTLVVPPHASVLPTSPPGLSKSLTIFFMLVTLLWVALVFLSMHVKILWRLLRPFRSGVDDE